MAEVHANGAGVINGAEAFNDIVAAEQAIDPTFGQVEQPEQPDSEAVFGLFVEEGERVLDPRRLASLTATGHTGNNGEESC
jgi:hypothetical protein